jgi:hypothetical protein
MAELRELPCPVDEDFPGVLDDDYSDREIALGRIKVNGCEAEIFAVSHSGRNDLYQWVSHACRFMMGAY